jgi:hypothetical protein
LLPSTFVFEATLLKYPAQNEQWFNFAGLNINIKKLERKVGSLERAAEK